MGKDCKAGWTELQNYRRAKAYQWIRSDPRPEAQRIVIEWEWRGHTDASGADWFILVETGTDQGFRCYPVTSPKKTSGEFKLKNMAHADLLRADLDLPMGNAAVGGKRLRRIAQDIPKWIEEYERVGAPLGSFAWLRR
jgi:hypothetical protein